tara:strand:- start:5273 stop:5413 length:141 start_codon:yes stop_codon:yes gene_type:complete
MLDPALTQADKLEQRKALDIELLYQIHQHKLVYKTSNNPKIQETSF